MTATLVTDKVLPPNPGFPGLPPGATPPRYWLLTAADQYEHVHLGHVVLPAAGRHRVKALARTQVLQNPLHGGPSDYIAVRVALFVDGVRVEGSETLLCFSAPGVWAGSSVPAEWLIDWDGQGAGEIDVRFAVFYNPPTRHTGPSHVPNVDWVGVVADFAGNCWLRAEPAV